MDMFPNAFIVNIEKADSVHFNQIGGKKMRGFFVNDKLHRVYIDGNAETIYFVRDSATNKVTDMQRSFSSRIWVMLENNEATRVGEITKTENRVIPIIKVKDDEKILKNFTWKPKDRPISKEAVLPSYNKKMKAAANTAKHPVAGEPRPKKLYGGKNGKAQAGKPGTIKAPADSLKSAAADSGKTLSPKKLPALKTKGDSVIKTKSGSDSVKISLPAGHPARRDTTKKP